MKSSQRKLDKLPGLSNAEVAEIVKPRPNHRPPANHVWRTERARQLASHFRKRNLAWGREQIIFNEHIKQLKP